MPRRISHPDGPEGVNPDVEGDEGDVHATMPDRRQQLGGEMQPGSRSRSRPLLRSEHSLVTRRIAQTLLDVGRRRHLPDPADFGKRIGDAGQAHGGGLTMPRVDRHRQLRAVEPNLRTRVQPARRTRQRFPAKAIAINWTEQEDLSLSPIPPASDQAGRNDPAVIEDQNITRVEVVRQLPDGGVADGTGRGLEHQHPGGVPLGGRVLRDQLRRQFVIEIRCSQKSRGWSLLAALTRPR